jgi:hypothetical protein
VPYFRVMLHGTGIEVPSAEGDEPPIVGFYTSRDVTASNEDAAVRAAADLVKAEWASGDYADANRGSVPELVPEGMTRIGLYDRWLSRTRGYTFYADDDAESPAA